MPMDPVSAFGGAAAGGVSAGAGRARGACADAAPDRAGANGQSAHSTHAQSADADECAVAPRNPGYYGGHGNGHRGCDYRGRAGCSGVGETAHAHRSQRRDGPQIVRGELAGRASIHAETIATKLDALPEADRSLRRRNRKIAVAIRTTGRSGEPAATARPQAEAAEPQKTSANEKPENRLRHAEGGL